MNNVITLNTDSLERITQTVQSDQVLYGLNKNEVAFLISTPDTGKGYLSLSLAYELAVQLPILGLSPCHKPIKTLYWGCEDSMGTIAKRILNHFSVIQPQFTALIQEHVKLYGNNTPICCSNRLINSNVGREVESARIALIETLKDFDFLIIDTLREAIGTASEIEDDILVKMALKEIANEANVAILAVHHLTKAATKGQESITSVSASGFSTTLANSRLQLLLEKTAKKNDTTTTLSHIKGNNVPEEFKLKAIPLHWDDMSVLYRNSNAYLTLTDLNEKPASLPIEEETEEFVEREPKTIYLSESDIPKEVSDISKRVQEKLQEKIDKEKSEYAKWLSKKKD